MRITSVQIFRSGITQMQNLNSQLATTQEQLSTGKRVVNPSDDPVATSQSLQIKEQQALREQFNKNIDAVENRLSTEDSLLDSVGAALIRIKELTIQAANTAVLTVEDRNSIAEELQQRVQGVLNTLNTQDANNEYLFSGYQGGTQPFTQQSSNGTVFYQGDEGQRLVQVASSSFIPINDSGYDVFVDIDSATNSFNTRASNINQSQPAASISAGFIYDQALYDSFYPEDIIIEFQDPNAVGPAQANYNVIQKSDGRILQSNTLHTSGQPIQINGAEFTITGTPTEGDHFFVESTNKLDLLTNVNQLIEGLRSLPEGPELRALLDKSLNNIDNAHNNILGVRGEIGGRLNTLEDTRSLHQDRSLIASERLSDLVDLDYAEAISRLNFETFVLQAAQQSFARVSNLTLFDQI